MTEFRFRYALRAHGSGYHNARAIAWSRRAATPLWVAQGRLPQGAANGLSVGIDPLRAIATCLKPADGDTRGAAVLRLWETGGRSDAIAIGLAGYRRAVRVDLVERRLEVLPLADGQVTVPLAARGFTALRLEP